MGHKMRVKLIAVDKNKLIFHMAHVTSITQTLHRISSQSMRLWQCFSSVWFVNNQFPKKYAYYFFSSVFAVVSYFDLFPYYSVFKMILTINARALSVYRPLF